jgi:hypothetical protein
MRPYSRVLYWVLFDTSLENESVTWCSKLKKKVTFLDGSVAKIKYNTESEEMDDEEFYVPDDVLEEATAAGMKN